MTSPVLSFVNKTALLCEVQEASEQCSLRNIEAAKFNRDKKYSDAEIKAREAIKLATNGVACKNGNQAGLYGHLTKAYCELCAAFFHQRRLIEAREAIQKAEESIQTGLSLKGEDPFLAKNLVLVWNCLAPILLEEISLLRNQGKLDEALEKVREGKRALELRNCCGCQTSEVILTAGRHLCQYLFEQSQILGSRFLESDQKNDINALFVLEVKTFENLFNERELDIQNALKDHFYNLLLMEGICLDKECCELFKQGLGNQACDLIEGLSQKIDKALALDGGNPELRSNLRDIQFEFLFREAAFLIFKEEIEKASSKLDEAEISVRGDMKLYPFNPKVRYYLIRILFLQANAYCSCNQGKAEEKLAAARCEAQSCLDFKLSTENRQEIETLLKENHGLEGPV